MFYEFYVKVETELELHNLAVKVARLGYPGAEVFDVDGQLGLLFNRDAVSMGDAIGGVLDDLDFAGIGIDSISLVREGESSSGYGIKLCADAIIEKDSSQ